MRSICVVCALVLLAIPTPVAAQSSAISLEGYPTGVVFSGEDQTIRIREESTLRVRPDTLYLLMKVETEGARLDHAIDRNKKAVEGFILALKEIRIDPSAVRLTNFIVEPLEMGSGVSFARNVVITITGIYSVYAPTGGIVRAPGGYESEFAHYGSSADDLAVRVTLTVNFNFK